MENNVGNGNLNGLGLMFRAFDNFQDKVMDAVIGAAGAGAGLYGAGALMSWDVIPLGGVKQSLDTILVTRVHAAAPGLARLALGAFGVPVLAKTLRGWRVPVPKSAELGATIGLSLVGGLTALKALAPGLLPALPGLAGAQLLIEQDSRSFAGAALSTEEVGKFGAIGGQVGPGFSSVMGGY